MAGSAQSRHCSMTCRGRGGVVSGKILAGSKVLAPQPQFLAQPSWETRGTFMTIFATKRSPLGKIVRVVCVSRVCERVCAG